MTDNEEREIEKIEAFYKGVLSPEEKQAFELQIANDSEFEERVIEYLQVMHGIKTVGEQQFLDKLQSWEEDMTAGEKTESNWRRIASIAAMILVVIIPIGYIAYNYLHLASSDKLYANYFTPYEDVISERGSNDYANAIDAYNLENYEKAISLFNSYLKANPNNMGARCYLGISQMASGKFEEAKLNLLEVSSDSSDLFKEVANWYLCLTYLKTKNNDALEEQLNNITSNPNHMFFNQADELQKQLNE